MQQATPRPATAPVKQAPPQIPAEFNAEAIMQLDAAKLIQILKDPAATVFQKGKACTRLAVIGGKDAVPAMAALLSHPQLSNYARFGLEPNPDPSADVVLRAALGQVKGRLLAGGITSIGTRRDAKAADSLGKLLNDADIDVAGAAASALAHIGGLASATILRQALGTVRPALQPVVARACLISAGGLMASHKAQALELYGLLSAAAMPGSVRLSAIRAMNGKG